MENFFNDIVQPWSYKLLIALIVFIVGRLLVQGVMTVTQGIMRRAKTDEILVNFISSILKMLLMLVVVVVALDQLGVDTTSLVALVGAAGLAVGLALKDSLQNFAAGVMLVLFRPFSNGDFVEVSGVAGIVEKITIFSTLIRTGDNKEVIVPNGGIYSGTITNYSARDTRRIDLVVGVDYGCDIKQAKSILEEILASHTLILKDPEPAVALAELADSSVNFNVRPWVKTDDYWTVRSDILEQVKLKLDEQGIGIPYPQMDVHLYKQNAG